MSFAPKEIIIGASVPMENGSSVTLSVAGHIETERDIDDAVVIFGRKLLKYPNCATDEDRLTVRQVVSSITSTPLDKVPDVGTPTSIPSPADPAKTSPSVTLDQVSPLPERMPAPTPAEQAAAAVRTCIKPPESAPEPGPSAPPEPEASAPSAPPEGFGICAECGEAVPSNQAKLSNLFMNKTLCKTCMDKSQGVS